MFTDITPRPLSPRQPSGFAAILRRRRPRKELLFILFGVVLLLTLGSHSYHVLSNFGSTETTNQGGFNKQQYSINDPASIWLVVNKHRPLMPKTFTPPDLAVPDVPLRVPGNETMQLRPDAAAALQRLFAAAKQDGLQLMLASGYRSYNYQVSLYNSYVQTQGKATADEQSARPGYSEHQTGLAADVEPVSRKCELTTCFGDLPEGKWLAANAYKFGFLLRYPADKVSVTGYEYEPWHFRYIGTELSNELHRRNIQTLEEFFGLGPAPRYT